MSARYRPPTIKETGLQNHLDITKPQHNNKGYDDFMRYMTGVNEFGKPYKKQDIVDAFGITWRTLYGWLEVYQQEQK